MKSATVPELTQEDLFTSGEGGYHTYRIPALAVAADGTVLAFCEGRMESPRDDAEIQIVLRRSGDNGATWQPMQVVASEVGHTVGNPCVVVDRDTGSVWLAFSKDNDQVYVTESSDNGASWSKPVEITQHVKRPDWLRYGPGPGHGIQMKSGRILIPCWHTTAFQRHVRGYSHAFYSDDHGESWQLGGDVAEGTNECEIVELSDGSLYITVRNGRPAPRGPGEEPVYPGLIKRLSARSNDGGLTWSGLSEVDELADPVCQASIVRYPEGASHEVPPILFSNPASTNRDNLSVRVSYDDCLTWPVSRTLNPGPSGYSDLAVLKDQTIGCLYAWGSSVYRLEHDQRWIEHVSFARFNIEWATHGSRRQD